MAKQERIRTIGLPPRDCELPRGGKNSTLTPAGYPKLANKFQVQGGMGQDITLNYKGRPAGRMSWDAVLEMGASSIRGHIQVTHQGVLKESVAGVSTKRRGRVYEFTARINIYRGQGENRKKVGEKKYVYHASEFILLAWGLHKMPSGFAFSTQLSHDKRDLRDAAAYAIRRQINYCVWKMNEARQRAQTEEALTRDKLKMPA